MKTYAENDMVNWGERSMLIKRFKIENFFLQYIGATLYKTCFCN